MLAAEGKQRRLHDGEAPSGLLPLLSVSNTNMILLRSRSALISSHPRDLPVTGSKGCMACHNKLRGTCRHLGSQGYSIGWLVGHTSV